MRRRGARSPMPGPVAMSVRQPSAGTGVGVSAGCGLGVGGFVGRGAVGIGGLRLRHQGRLLQCPFNRTLEAAQQVRRGGGVLVWECWWAPEWGYRWVRALACSSGLERAGAPRTGRSPQDKTGAIRIDTRPLAPVAMPTDRLRTT